MSHRRAFSKAATKSHPVAAAALSASAVALALCVLNLRQRSDDDGGVTAELSQAQQSRTTNLPTASTLAAAPYEGKAKVKHLTKNDASRHLSGPACLPPPDMFALPTFKIPKFNVRAPDSILTPSIGSEESSGFISTSPFYSFSKISAFQRDYDVDWGADPLGAGGFGTVHIATHRKTGNKVAVKRVPKRPEGYTQAAIDHVMESVQRERQALRHIQYAGGGHPHICSIRDEYGCETSKEKNGEDDDDDGDDDDDDDQAVNHAHDDEDYCYLVLELITGGELFDHLCQNGAYSESDAARLIREVASALAFLHGIGVVHCDLKPENLLMSTPYASSAAIKLVDFGAARVTVPTSPYYNAHNLKNTSSVSTISTTPGYSSPELLVNAEMQQDYAWKLEAGISGLERPPDYVPDPSIDMWSLGVILYIMLTGAHPFDLSGTSTDEDMNLRVKSHSSPPMEGAQLTSHLSDSAVALLSQLLDWDPKRRLTALELLHHPWVLGETAGKDKMSGSDARLKSYRKYKSKLAAKVFASMVGWSGDNREDGGGQVEMGRDGGAADAPSIKKFFKRKKLKTGQAKTEEDGTIAKRTSLIERSFQMLDPDHKGYISKDELSKLVKESSSAEGGSSSPDDGESLSLSGFSDLLAENMKNRYFPAGHIVYREGDKGHKMYFINSGRIEVFTKDGFRTVSQQGDFFGEGALLHPKSIRSATIKCLTPVHAIEISREYFEKYIAGDDELQLNLRETDKSRKRQRAKTILKLQRNLVNRVFRKGEALFEVGEEGNDLYILEEGMIGVEVDNHYVFVVKPGGLCGEHSLILGRPRNTSAKCITDTCKCLVMRASDFYKLMDSHPSVRESLRDICHRREFQKALVFKTGKSFPDHADEAALRKAFDAADDNQSGKLDLSDIGLMLKRLDPTLTDQDVKEILKSLDLDQTGAVSFNEFKQIFGQ